MPDNIKALAEKRDDAYRKLKEMRDTASAENRDFTSEEQQQWDACNADYDKYDGEIKAAREQENTREERDRRLAEMERTREAPLYEDRSIGREDTDERGNPKPPDSEQRNEVRDELPALTTGCNFWEHRSSQQYREAFGRRMSPEYRDAFDKWLRVGERNMSPAEYRALQVDVDAGGGYITASEQFIANLIKARDRMVFVRQVGTVLPMTNADAISAPSLDNDPADPTWTAEIKTGSEDSTMSFGKRMLTPHPLAQSIRISRTLLRKSLIPAETLVRDRLNYKAAYVEENAYLNGHGNNQPLGVFTASNDGIDTGQDVNTSNTATAIKADNLIECKYTLRPVYHPNAAWCMHQDTLKKIRLMKDGNGDYLWRAGLAGDKQDTILDIPYFVSEFAPNTYTSALYVAVLGDWSYYWIADSLNIQIQRLEELYAATNQVGFISRQETDGMPVLAEAFVRSKMGN